MGNSQSELSNSLTNLPKLANKPAELRAEVQNFVASVPLKQELPLRVDGKKLVPLVLQLLRDEYQQWRKSQTSMDLLMAVNAATRLCKTRGFYTHLPTNNITIIVDILKSSTQDTVLLLSTLQLVSYILNCRVTPEANSSEAKKWVADNNKERDEWETKVKIAWFESGGYEAILHVLQHAWTPAAVAPTASSKQPLQQQTQHRQTEVIALSLDILSLDLVDHMSTSRLVILQKILSMLKNHWETILQLTIDDSNAKIRSYASLLLQGLMLHSTVDRCIALQNKVLIDGYILYYILFAIDGKDVIKDPQYVPSGYEEHPYAQYYDTNLTHLTRNLLSLLTANHPWNQELIFRAIPQPLWIAIRSSIAATAAANANNKDKPVVAKEASKNDRQAVENTLLYAFTTQKIQRIDWHSVFSSLDKQQRSPQLIWNTQSKSELIGALVTEIQYLQVTKQLQQQQLQSPTTTAVTVTPKKYNYAAFDIQYASLNRYLKVNGYYISRLISALQNPKTRITQKTTNEIQLLAVSIYQRMTIELKLDWKLACLRALRCIYQRFGVQGLKLIQTIPYLIYILNEYHQHDDPATPAGHAYKAQNLLRDVAFDFLLVLLREPVNVSVFVEFHGLQALLYHLNAVHLYTDEQLQTVVTTEAGYDSSNTRRQFLISFIESLTGVKQIENAPQLAPNANGALPTGIQNAPTAAKVAAAQQQQPIAEDAEEHPAEAAEADDDALNSNELTAGADAKSPRNSSDDDLTHTTNSIANLEDLLADLPAPYNLLQIAERSLALLILVSRAGARVKKQVSTHQTISTLTKQLFLPYTEVRQIAMQLLIELLDDAPYLLPTLQCHNLWCILLYTLQFNVLPQCIELIDKYLRTDSKALLQYFPSPIIQHLNTHPAQQWCELLTSAEEVNTTALRWSPQMFQTLIATVNAELLPFQQKLHHKPQAMYPTAKQLLTITNLAELQPLSAGTTLQTSIKYDSLGDELCVSSIYIKQFNADAMNDLESVVTTLQSINLNVNTLFEELMLYIEQDRYTSSDQLIACLQALIYVTKRYHAGVDAAVQYDIKQLMAKVQVWTKAANATNAPSADGEATATAHSSASAALQVLEKSIELLHCLLPLNSEFAATVFNMKGLDLLITSIDQQFTAIHTASQQHTQTLHPYQATQHIPTLYYLLHCVAVMASQHPPTMKHLEYTPTLVQQLLQMLQLSEWGMKYPNATMATCKCLYTFIQHSAALREQIIERGGLLLLLQLVLYYEAPAYLKNRKAVGEHVAKPAAAAVDSAATPRNDENAALKVNGTHSTSSKRASGTAKDGNKAAVDWTSKIRLGAAYVLSTMSKTLANDSSPMLSNLFNQLLGKPLNQLLQDTPQEFLQRTANPSDKAASSIKQQLQPYIQQQLQLIDAAGDRWQEYRSGKLSFTLHSTE